MTPANDLAAGAIFGNYRIERLLGRGAMGAVYAAEQLDDGRHVAIKVLVAGLDSDADRERFIREGRVAASINHPNTVYVYRTEEIEGTPTITMELVDGGTLEEKVERAGPLSIVDAMHDTLQIVDGLDAAHRVGILHRDVKPANCFVGPSGEVKVGDFGLSRPVDQVDQIRLTQTGLFLGTPVFSSPEQLLGEVLDMRSDIYAVGATLYYLLTGKFPFEADNAARLIAVVMSSTPRPLSTHRSDVPAKLEAIVSKCLARSREQRFSDYASLRAALEEFMPARLVAAPLGLRISAGIADQAVLALSSSGMVWLLSPISMAILAKLGGSKVNFELVRDGILDLALTLMLFGFAEGRWGWSIGKLVAGLRVSSPAGGAPGVRRGCTRAVLFWLPTFTGAVAQLISHGASHPERINGWVGFATLVALFARARRNNGFATEYDRITNTRVVRKPVLHARAHSATHETMPVPELPANARRLGPYEIVSPFHASLNASIGFDPQLKRVTWVLESTPSTPPMPAAVRNATRATCLRWIGSSRTENESWDAFAAVPGQTFRERLNQPIHAANVHDWLADLASELAIRNNEGQGSSSYTVDNVWINDDDHAVVLPFSLAELGDSQSMSASESLLRAVAREIATKDGQLQLRRAWPTQTRELLRCVDNDAENFAAICASADTSIESLPVVTFESRFVLAAATILPLVVVTIPLALSIWDGQKNRPNEGRIALFVTYVDRAPTFVDQDAIGVSRDSFFLRKAGVPFKVGVAGNAKAIVADAAAAKIIREQAAIYLVAHFKRNITDRPAGGIGAMSRREWKIADSLVRTHPTITPQQLLDADHLVDSVWHGTPPGTREPAGVQWTRATFGVGIMSLFVAIMAALLFRRGLPSRMLRMDFVSFSGNFASRAALIVRHLLTWLPVFAVVVFAVEFGVERIAFNVPSILFAAACASFIALNIWSMVRWPSSSLIDRLTRMSVVRE